VCWLHWLPQLHKGTQKQSQGHIEKPSSQCADGSRRICEIHNVVYHKVSFTHYPSDSTLYYWTLTLIFHKFFDRLLFSYRKKQVTQRSIMGFHCPVAHTIREGRSRVLENHFIRPQPFGIGHMYVCTFLLRMTDTVTSRNTDPFSWDTCIYDRVTGPSYGTRPAEYDAIQTVSKSSENTKYLPQRWICDSPGGYYEEYGFLGCNAM
jgi:hypothetical protein